MDEEHTGNEPKAGPKYQLRYKWPSHFKGVGFENELLELHLIV